MYALIMLTLVFGIGIEIATTGVKVSEHPPSVAWRLRWAGE
jgi:hypothetical protein